MLFRPRWREPVFSESKLMFAEFSEFNLVGVRSCTQGFFVAPASLRLGCQSETSKWIHLLLANWEVYGGNTNCPNQFAYGYKSNQAAATSANIPF